MIHCINIKTQILFCLDLSFYQRKTKQSRLILGLQKLLSINKKGYQQRDCFADSLSFKMFEK